MKIPSFLRPLLFSRLAARRSRPEPRIDPLHLADYQRRWQAAGVEVVIGLEAEEYLQLRGGEAAYWPDIDRPGTIFLRADPSRAAVAEEDYHFRQHRLLNWRIRDQLHAIELEIEAQIWLLAHARRQGWTKQEQRRFRAARSYWEEMRSAEVQRFSVEAGRKERGS